jgi:hypothetical protein
MEKKKNYTNLVLIGLAVLAAFLAGSAWTKIRTEGGVSPQQAASQPSPAVEAAQTFEAEKADKPVVKFFVMAFCPYGNQAEEGLKPVYELLKDKVDWQPRYIVSDGLKEGEWESLHGEQELNQDVREICAFKMGDLNKWWQFVSLVNKNCTYENADICWEKQAQEAKLATSQISTCLNSQKTSLLTAELAEANKYQAQGSPTVYINDVLYQGGRSPEDYKKAICESFTEAPKECETVLGSESSGAQGGCN